MNILFPPNQELVLVNMLIVGIILGVVFDCLEIKRRLFINSAIFIIIDDIIFTFISAVVFLSTVFISNNGIIRWYEFALCILGFVIYKITVSRIVIRVFGFVALLLRRTITTPIKLLFKFIKKMFCAIVKILTYIFRFLIGLSKPLIFRIESNASLYKLNTRIQNTFWK